MEDNIKQFLRKFGKRTLRNRVGCENTAATAHHCEAVNSAQHVVCSRHVLMCGAQVLMGWPERQHPYSIIAPCQQHNKTNQSIGATSTRISSQSPQSSSALWKPNKAARSNKRYAWTRRCQLVLTGSAPVKGATQIQTIAADRTSYHWLCLCNYFLIDLDIFCTHKPID